MRVDVDGTVLFALPGVPIEMEAIFEETIAPLIKQAVGRAFSVRKAFLQITFLNRVWHL